MLFRCELLQTLLGNVFSFSLSSEIQVALHQFFQHVFHFTEKTSRDLLSAFSTIVLLHQKYPFSQVERELSLWLVLSHVSVSEHERRSVLRECMADNVYFSGNVQVSSNSNGITNSNSNSNSNQLSFSKLCLLFDILTVLHHCVTFNNM